MAAGRRHQTGRCSAAGAYFCPRVWTADMAFLSFCIRLDCCFPTTSLTNPEPPVGPLIFGDWPDACVMQRGLLQAPNNGPQSVPLTSAAATAPRSRSVKTSYSTYRCSALPMQCCFRYHETARVHREVTRADQPQAQTEFLGAPCVSRRRSNSPAAGHVTGCAIVSERR